MGKFAVVGCKIETYDECGTKYRWQQKCFSPTGKQRKQQCQRKHYAHEYVVESDIQVEYGA